MAKKLTAAKAKEILHDKEVHGHPLTEKQRKFFGAIAGGAPIKKKENGGWLDKYEEGGEFLGTTNAGFDYNPTWGGQFAHGGEIMNVASPQNPIAQEGTEITPNPEVEYYKNWLTNRKPQLLNNIGGGNVDEEISKQVRNMSLAKELPIEGLLDEMKKRGKNPAGILESYNNSYGITYPAIININDKYEEEYNPAIISYRELSPDRDVKLHERVHAARPPYQSLPQVEKISEFIPVNHSYGDDPHEVYSRLMEFRRMNNIDPLKKFNMEDLREMRLSPSIKDRDIIHRYGDDQVLKLLNEIAQNKPTSQPTPIAQNGAEMSFYQHGNDWQPKTISEDGAIIPINQSGGVIPSTLPSLTILKTAISSMLNRRQLEEAPPPSIPEEEFLTISDPRKIRMTTGKPMDPKRDLVSGKYSARVIDTIFNRAKRSGLNEEHALNLAAIGLQESLLGTTDSSIGHTTDDDGGDPYDRMISIYKEKMATADRLKWKDPELRLQLYNGVGIITPKTDKNYHGYEMQSIYGVPIPPKGINMRENPLYGRQIIDLRDNVLKKNPEIMRHLDKYYESGGVIEDNMGQWAHPGEVTKIASNDITMYGVPYPVLGISNTGDRQMMYPGQDYQFEGDSVTEYPMAKYGINQLDEKTEEHLDNLLNFTNKPSKKGWLEKYS